MYTFYGHVTAFSQLMDIQGNLVTALQGTVPLLHFFHFLTPVIQSF